jgi:hypothetical protein
MEMPMDTTRIKMKVGENELDAEGSQDFVQAQVAAFQAMISSVPRETMAQKSEPSRNGKEHNGVTPAFPHIDIEKIMHVSGRVVSLTALPASPADAALLIMLGHKDMRNNLSVTGQEIGDGLNQSGRGVPRVDRIMDKTIEESLVLKTGLRRGTRYRLTNQGLTKALGIAEALIASLP